MGPPELIMSLDGHYDFYEISFRKAHFYCILFFYSIRFFHTIQPGRKEGQPPIVQIEWLQNVMKRRIVHSRGEENKFPNHNNISPAVYPKRKSRLPSRLKGVFFLTPPPRPVFGALKIWKALTRVSGAPLSAINTWTP